MEDFAFLRDLITVSAKLAQGTSRTFRRACRTSVSSELNYPMAEVGLPLGSDKLAHDKLDLVGILKRFIVHAKASAYSYAMSIGDDSGLFVYISEQKIRY